jgi:hypothetical protein
MYPKIGYIFKMRISHDSGDGLMPIGLPPSHGGSYIYNQGSVEGIKEV